MEVSKLGVPLLMVNGYFRNLKSLTVEELETFIPFMTKCSLTKGKAKIVNGQPEWWVKTIRYNFPLKKPKGLSDLGYKRHLQSIVCKCYCYHDAHFLLSFSSKFSKQPYSIFLRNNENNTTSVFSFENDFTELFTFDNENKDYDKPKEKCSRMSLLPVQSSKPPNQEIPDIYLCENCDVEFYSYLDIKMHEKECFGSRLQNDSADEMEDISYDELMPLANEQHNFLSTFGLKSKAEEQQRMALETPVQSIPDSSDQYIPHSTPQSTFEYTYESPYESTHESAHESAHESTHESAHESTHESALDSSFESPLDSSFDSTCESSFESAHDTSFDSTFESSFESSVPPESTVQPAVVSDDNNSPSTPTKRWVALSMCLHKNKKIEFSSAIGRKMLNHKMKQDVLGNAEKALQVTEMYCSTGQRPYRETRESFKPRLTYRTAKRLDWAHTYPFSKRQKIEKMKVLKTGLNKRSRKLLRQCKNRKVRVNLLRLNLPEDAEFFVISFNEGLITPYRLTREETN